MNFSKRKVAMHIDHDMCTINQEFEAHMGHEIDPANGWAQCNEDHTAMYLFGRWESLEQLFYGLGLDDTVDYVIGARGPEMKRAS